MVDSSSYWTCAQTNPQQEKIALTNLRLQNYKAFFPFFFVVDRYQHPRICPIFPGYLFIHLSEETRWHRINHTHGIIRLLTTCGDDNPCQIPEEFIEGIKRLRVTSDFSEGLPASRYRPKAGDRVTITSGALAGHNALVKRAGRQRVAVLLSLLGRQVEVSVAINLLSQPMPLADPWTLATHSSSPTGIPAYAV